MSKNTSVLLSSSEKMKDQQLNSLVSGMSSILNSRERFESQSFIGSPQTHPPVNSGVSPYKAQPIPARRGGTSEQSGLSQQHASLLLDPSITIAEAATLLERQSQNNQAAALLSNNGSATNEQSQGQPSEAKTVAAANRLAGVSSTTSIMGALQGISLAESPTIETPQVANFSASEETVDASNQQPSIDTAEIEAVVQPLATSETSSAARNIAITTTEDTTAEDNEEEPKENFADSALASPPLTEVISTEAPMSEEADTEESPVEQPPIQASIPETPVAALDRSPAASVSERNLEQSTDAVEPSIAFESPVSLEPSIPLESFISSETLPELGEPISPPVAERNTEPPEPSNPPETSESALPEPTPPVPQENPAPVESSSATDSSAETSTEAESSVRESTTEFVDEPINESVGESANEPAEFANPPEALEEASPEPVSIESTPPELTNSISESESTDVAADSITEPPTALEFIETDSSIPEDNLDSTEASAPVIEIEPVSAAPDGNTENAEFFPFGFYYVDYDLANGSNIYEKQLEAVEAIADAGFNTVHLAIYNDLGASANIIDRANDLGLSVLADHQSDLLRTDVVQGLQNSSNVLGWNIGDDVNVNFSPSQLNTIDATVKQFDERPTYTSLFDPRPEVIREYVDSSDWIGLQSYPIGERRIDSTFDEVKSAVDSADLFGDTPIIANLQTFAWDEVGAGDPGRLPTFDEVRNMTFQALAAGAEGILYYTYRDSGGLLPEQGRLLWNAMPSLVPEVQAVESWVQNGERMAIDVDDRYIKATWTLGDRQLLMAINTGYDSVAVEFSGFSSELGLSPVAMQSLGQQQTDSTLTLGADGSITGTLAPLDVQLYQIQL